MAQGDDLKRTGNYGGMDTDSAPEDIAPNDSIERVNLRNSGTQGQTLGYDTNIGSTVPLSGALPAGINNIIGGGSFDETGQILALRYNNAGKCQILLYDFDTNTYSVIYTDGTDSGGATLLPLNPQKQVTAILINDIYAIWWAEDLEVGYTNLKTLASGGYGMVLWEDLSLLKPQCMIPISRPANTTTPNVVTSGYGNDTGQAVNHLYGKLPQFIVQYINEDFNYSAWSTRSKRFTPYQQNTPTLGVTVSQNNYTIVSVNAGSIRAVTLNIGCQFDDSGDFSTIKSVDRAYIIALPNTAVDLSTQVTEAYDPATNLYSFIFYNNSTAIPIDPNETDLAFDEIYPSNAGGLLNGNIPALGDWKTLYERPTTDVTITAIGYNPNIGIPVGTYTNPLIKTGQFNGASGSGAGGHRRIMEISMAGVPHTGDIIVIILGDIRNATNTLNYNYPVPMAQDGDLAAVVASVTAKLPASSYVNVGGDYTITFTGDPYFGLQTYSIELFFAGASVANSIPTGLDNTSCQFAIRYFDYKGRYFPLCTGNNYIVASPSYAQQNGLATEFVVQINTAAAPEGATGYQIMITKPTVIKILDTTAVALTYKGAWDAKANSPLLHVNEGNIGDTYQITTPSDSNDPTHYTNLGTGEPYPTGDYITNIGGTSGGSQSGQYYAVLPKSFGNLAGVGSILAFSLNSLALLNAEYADQNVTTNLVYSFAKGDRCTFHYWVGSAGAINTLGTIAPGSGYTNGTYTNIALTGGTGTGAHGTVTVAGGIVTAVVITIAGTGYTIGDVLTGTVTGGTLWSVPVQSLVVNGINYFNNPCIDVAVLGYDAGTYLVKVENSSALTYSNGHIYYNGAQIDARNIFMRLYSPAPQNASTSTTQNATQYFEIGERFTITNGVHDVTNIVITDGGAYYKTRQFPDAIQPYTNPPISVLATDFHYSDFYFSPYYSFGRVGTYYDVLEKSEQKALIITGQAYVLGSRINGLNRFYPQHIYGNNNGQCSSSKGAIQVMDQIGQVLRILQERGVFYIPINEAYTVVNDELTGQSISSVLLNNGRYDTKDVGIGLTKCYCRRYNTSYFADPNTSLPYRIVNNQVESIAGKMSTYFKNIIQLSVSLGKIINMFYSDRYEEVVMTIQANGGQLYFFPFSLANWNPLSGYVIVGTDVSATPNGAHCTASYNSATGIVTYTPTPGYVGGDTPTFTANNGSGAITLNNCLIWTAGSGTVNTFIFAEQDNVALSTNIDSNTITVVGNDYPVAISVTGGYYSINGGSFVNTAGTVNAGDIVQARVMSSGSYFTATFATVTIDGQSANFTVATIAGAPANTFNIINNSGTLSIQSPSIQVDAVNYPQSINITPGGNVTDSTGAGTASSTVIFYIGNGYMPSSSALTASGYGPIAGTWTGGSVAGYITFLGVDMSAHHTFTININP